MVQAMIIVVGTITLLHVYPVPVLVGEIEAL